MENQHDNLSVEELKARKSEMLAFYKDSMPYLKAQLSYEELLTKIEEQRFKRTHFQYQFAMMMQGATEAQEENTEHPVTNGASSDIPENDKKPSRKLKTE